MAVPSVVPYTSQMIGPHQRIMSSLTGTAQGALLWIIHFSELSS